jgi:hypothetical protein
VSSRQEEKERRRQERLAKEQAEARAAGRRKRLQLAFGGVLALVLVAGLTAVALGVIGGGGSDSEGNGGGGKSPSSTAKLPLQQISDIKDAAKAAGCKLLNAPFEGQNHTDKDFKASDYKTNPPTSGDHAPDWYEDGIYAPGDTPEIGKTVHPLEHGRIVVQYKPGTPAKTVDELEALLAENDDGYHMLMLENPSGMEAQVAATAWTHSITCPAMNDKVFDALRTFRSRYIDKGPENVP